MVLEQLNRVLRRVKETVYDNSILVISDLVIESEGKAYKACNFKLNGLHIICRNAKITPKKIGQFVTFWKRNQSGITEPFSETDEFDFYVINVLKEDRIGQFIFPKSVLIKKGIVSTTLKDGKRGFRVYPSWDMPSSKQAEKTQKWQTKYFIEIDEKTDFKEFEKLYSNN